MLYQLDLGVPPQQGAYYNPVQNVKIYVLANSWGNATNATSAASGRRAAPGSAPSLTVTVFLLPDSLAKPGPACGAALDLGPHDHPLGGPILISLPCTGAGANGTAAPVGARPYLLNLSSATWSLDESPTNVTLSAVAAADGGLNGAGMVWAEVRALGTNAALVVGSGGGGGDGAEVGTVVGATLGAVALVSVAGVAAWRLNRSESPGEGEGGEAEKHAPRKSIGLGFIAGATAPDGSMHGGGVEARRPALPADDLEKAEAGQCSVGAAAPSAPPPSELEDCVELSSPAVPAAFAQAKDPAAPGTAAPGYSYTDLVFHAWVQDLPSQSAAASTTQAVATTVSAAGAEPAPSGSAAGVRLTAGTREPAPAVVAAGAPAERQWAPWEFDPDAGREMPAGDGAWDLGWLRMDRWLAWTELFSPPASGPEPGAQPWPSFCNFEPSAPQPRPWLMEPSDLCFCNVEPDPGAAEKRR